MNDFNTKPILNSPYEYPNKHWELDKKGSPTGKISESRRVADFMTPIPKPKKQKGKSSSQLLSFGAIADQKGQVYDHTAKINQVRKLVEHWRKREPRNWHVTPETRKLLQYWRDHKFDDIRPFFCQIEAVETVIYLTEVATRKGASQEEKEILNYLKSRNEEANPKLSRLALKLATGAGKTNVMAMIIAWQTMNATCYPKDKRFTKNFLVVTPGITIKDRLRVLQPNGANSYYKKQEIMPHHMCPEMNKANVIITNYHAFMLRDTLSIPKVAENVIQGRGEPIQKKETNGEMIRRVKLDRMKNIMVLNDEAHHCYRARVGYLDDIKLKGEEKKEADEENETGRVWINGIETVKEQLGVNQVIDLSATPFFLKGSGYQEGTLFGWTLSDFSLMDAIECGIVKIPRVPVLDNMPNTEMPKYRNLWEHIGKDMPKRVNTSKRKGEPLNPLKLPTLLKSALDAIYDNYKETFDAWDRKDNVRPCFIIVCNNTVTSKLVYDYISGFQNEDGSVTPAQFKLFSNYNKYNQILARPRTLLIDSKQLESGDKLDKKFLIAAKEEIEQFRKEYATRSKDHEKAQKMPEQVLLREVMNTVGKPDSLGTSIRCVVSVSMLTEGWDASNVTHILGVRAFGTQLLCEQVIGRALRRQSYESNEEKLFNPEYADILGVPFNFTAEPVVTKPQPPPQTIHIQAMPDRKHLEIEFPRVEGFRIQLPNTTLKAKFNENSRLKLTHDLLGPSVTIDQGIIGESTEIGIKPSRDMRTNAVLFSLTKYLMDHWLDADEDPKRYLFHELKSITRRWLNEYLDCDDKFFPGQLLYPELAERACEKINAAIIRYHVGEEHIIAMLAPYAATGTTDEVDFKISEKNKDIWRTDPRKCHINYLVNDSNGENEFCRIVEKHPSIISYVKNHNLGLEIPYLDQTNKEPRRYRPDFIVKIDDGRGTDDPLHLIVEIKGRDETLLPDDDKMKKDALETRWIPGVNYLADYGRWESILLTNIDKMESEFYQHVERFVREGPHWNRPTRHNPGPLIEIKLETADRPNLSVIDGTQQTADPADPADSQPAADTVAGHKPAAPKPDLRVVSSADQVADQPADQMTDNPND